MKSSLVNPKLEWLVTCKIHDIVGILVTLFAESAMALMRASVTSSKAFFSLRNFVFMPLILSSCWNLLSSNSSSSRRISCSWSCCNNCVQKFMVKYCQVWSSIVSMVKNGILSSGDWRFVAISVSYWGCLFC